MARGAHLEWLGGRARVGLGEAVTQIWQALHEHLLAIRPDGPGLRVFGRNGPTRRVFDEVITRIVSIEDPATGLPVIVRRALSRSVQLSAAQVEELDRQHWEALPVLVLAAEWVAEIKAALPSLPAGWDDKAFAVATEKALAGLAPDPGTVADICAGITGRTADRAAFRDLLDDPAALARWEQVLDERWAAASWRAGTAAPAGRGEVEELLELLALRAEETPEERADRDRRYRALVSSTGDDAASWWMAGRRPQESLLTTRDRPERPSVLPHHDGRALPAPLDRSIAQRLEPGSPYTVVPRTQWGALVDAEIDRSCEPLGLAERPHRTLLAAALELAARVELTQGQRPHPGAGRAARQLYRKLDVAQVGTARKHAKLLELDVYGRWPVAWIADRLWSVLAQAERRGEVLADRIEVQTHFWRAVSSFVKDQQLRTRAAIQRGGPGSFAPTVVRRAPAPVALPVHDVQSWLSACYAAEVAVRADVATMLELYAAIGSGDAAAVVELEALIDRLAEALAAAGKPQPRPTPEALVDYLARNT